jgi:hypothetical protein
MNRDELFSSVLEAAPSLEGIVYVERWATSYSWRLVTTGAARTEPVDEPRPTRD